MKLSETTTALDAIKFKSDIDNQLKNTAIQYATMIHKQCISYGVYTPKCKTLIMDWLYYSIAKITKEYCNKNSITFTDIALTDSISGSGGSDTGARVIYIKLSFIQKFCTSIADDLSTFVSAPSDKNHNEESFTIDAIAEGLLDGYHYSLSNTDKAELINTILHEISHLQQTKTPLANKQSQKQANILKTLSGEDKSAAYLNHTAEIDAWANGQVAQYVLMNPDFNLADIKNEVVYITKAYSNYERIPLTLETKKKFASKVFKLLHQIYKDRK
jgi:hypothetical protein